MAFRVKFGVRRWPGVRAMGSSDRTEAPEFGRRYGGRNSVVVIG